MTRDLRPDALSCPICGLKFNALQPHIKIHGFLDAEHFKKEFNLPTLRAPSLCKEHSRRMITNNPNSGNTVSEETRSKISQNRLGKGIGVAGKYERTPAIRSKISRSVCNIPQHDFGRGEFVYSEKMDCDFFLRSSWEKRVQRVLDLHPCVESFEWEPFTIPYMFEGVEHRYMPDIKVVLEGGIIEIWEVKPLEYIRGKNLEKICALNSYAAQHGYNTNLVTSIDQIMMYEQMVGIREWCLPFDPPFYLQSIVRYRHA